MLSAKYLFFISYLLLVYIETKLLKKPQKFSWKQVLLPSEYAGSTMVGASFDIIKLIIFNKYNMVVYLYIYIYVHYHIC